MPIPVPSIPGVNAAKIAGDIASAFLRANAEAVASKVVGPLGWLKAPLVGLIRQIADAVDQLGE